MTRKQSIGAIAVFALIIYAVPLIQAGLEIKDGEVPHIVGLFTNFPTEKFLREWEGQMEDRSFIENGLRPPMQYLTYVLGRDAGSKAIVGRDGWLFYTPVLDYLTGPYYDDVRITSPVDGAPKQNWDVIGCIEDFRRQLNERDIELLVVPVPAKLTIMPDKATSRSVSDRLAMGAHTLRLIGEMEKRGIPVVNLFKPFVEARAADTEAEQELYMFRDTHWTPRGLMLAARLVAERVRQFPWYKDMVCISDYELKRKEVSRQGDIGAMTQIPKNRELFPDETTICYQVIDQVTGKPYRNKDELDWQDIYSFFTREGRREVISDIDVQFDRILKEFGQDAELKKELDELKKKNRHLTWEEVYDHFRKKRKFRKKIDVRFKKIVQNYLAAHQGRPAEDDEICATPVLLLGDSFSRIFQTDAPRSAGFVAHLAYELKTPLEAIVNNGGASTLVREQLVRKVSKLKGKKLVIWEFTERDVVFGMKGWEKLALP